MKGPREVQSIRGYFGSQPPQAALKYEKSSSTALVISRASGSWAKFLAGVNQLRFITYTSCGLDSLAGKEAPS